MKLNRWEYCLWFGSAGVIAASFLLFSAGDILTLIASLIGVTALIFNAKGYALGQLLIVIFSVLYGIISFEMRYYGEMITYLGMSAPIAVLTMIEWLRHPFGDTREVTVSRMTRRKVWILLLLTIVTTGVFYFILRALGNASLFFSTVSVATSFLAVALTLLRSPYYAIGYAANDIVLIILWVIAAREQAQYLPMVICFSLFLLNDLYGFYSWRRMQRRQESIDKDALFS